MKLSSWKLGLAVCCLLTACRNNNGATESPRSPSQPTESTRDDSTQAKASPQDEETSTSTARPIIVSEYGAFADWDTNHDGQIERSEFDQRLTATHVFADWDADNNGELNDLEFTTALYKAWDVNGDEKVDVYEYRFGNGAWFANGQMYGTFSDWDADGNDELSLVEMRDKKSKLLAAWSQDERGSISKTEFDNRLYRAWDVDGDGIVDLYEFNRVAHNDATSSDRSGKASKDCPPMVVGYGNFTAYDANADSKVTLDEFRSMLAKTSLFKDLSAVEQGNVRSADFRGKLFEFWDLDGDEVLDLAEFKHGAGVFFPKVDTYGNFQAWDANGDGKLTKEEFVKYRGANRIETDWDKNKDHTVEPKDVSAVMYEAWDVNGDGVLDAEEWRWW